MPQNETAALVREVYAPGDLIFFEGEVEKHFYIVEKGSVSIFTKTKDGNKIEITVITEGESFGEFALLDNSPRSASAQAISEVHVIKVSEAGYEELLNEIPGWASSMLKSFMARLKNMNNLLRSMDQFPKK